MKPPTDPDLFFRKSPLDLQIIARRGTDGIPGFRVLPEAQKDWFYKHCDLSLRSLHANKPDFRAWLEGKRKRIDPRAQAIVWIKHWATAFVMDPQRYMERHRHSLLKGTK